MHNEKKDAFETPVTGIRQQNLVIKSDNNHFSTI